MTLSCRSRRALRALLYPCLPFLALQAAPALADPGCQGPPSDTHVNVTVEGIRASTGLIAVTLYADDSRRFLVKHGSMYVGRVPTTAPVTHMCLNVPKPGMYALAIYHDANGNKKFDRRGFLGLPAEAYGFSNNPPTFFSLPRFSSVRIALHDGSATSIRLKYP